MGFVSRRPIEAGVVGVRPWQVSLPVPLNLTDGTNAIRHTDRQSGGIDGFGANCASGSEKEDQSDV